MKNGFKYSRYAHSEGHTAICYTHDGKYLVTCGTDCDVRVWSSNGLEDESPLSVTLRESATSIVECNDVLYIGSGHFVEAYKYPELKFSERPLRFTAPVTDIDISSDGKILVAGSCDMKIKVKNKVTEEIIELSGHTAPILKVVLSLDAKYVASSSGDGSVKVWDTSTGAALKTFSKIIPTSNDFSSAVCLGTPAWFDQSHLVITNDTKVCFHNVRDWSLAYHLSSPKITRSISVISIADHVRLLCAATTIGEIIVWNLTDHSVVKYLEDRDKVAITSVSWSPTRIEFACCDRLGRLHLASAEECDEIKDGDVEDNSENVDTENIDMKEDDENAISINDIKASVPLTQSDIEGDEDDDCGSEASERVKKTKETVLQRPFQPSSTPSRFEHRYMVWNSIGIIRSHSSEKDSSIDIDFHDTMLHHSIHRRNPDGYEMAALSCKVLFLASRSMLTCIHLNGWDDKKEWSFDMPEDESITAVAASGNWVCCATDLNQLRFYTYTGIQRQVVCLSGPVVCINGHDKLLIVVTHLGHGLSGSQNLGCTIFEITDFFVRALTPCQPMPISPGGILQWAGFTDEGTPCTYDSAGVLRLSRNFRSWEVFCNMRLHCKNESDHYFVIGVSERLQCIRCILCKGSRYPLTLPRPTVVEIPLKIPLCNPDETKTSLEDVFWRNVFSLPVLDELSRENDDYRTAFVNSEKFLKQTIIKLFAEAYRNRADMRAVSLASLMSENTLEMAMKLVQGDGRMYLADKLHKIEPKDWNDIRQGPTSNDNVENCVGLATGFAESYALKEIKNKAYTHKSQGDMFELSQPGASTGSRQLSNQDENSTPEDKSNPRICTSSTNFNPFKVKNKEDSGPKGLTFFNNVKQPSAKQAKPDTPIPEKVSKGKQTNLQKEKSNSAQKLKFFDWFKKNKSSLQERYPDLSMNEIAKAAMKLFKEEMASGSQNQVNETSENADAGVEPASKKQKMEDVKASAADKLGIYNFMK